MTKPRQSLGWYLLLAAGTALLAPVAAIGAVSVGFASLPASAAASAHAASDIPPSLLVLYRQSALRCPGLPWPVLAGIGKVESNHNRPPRQISAVGAQGPMQFMPATWAADGTDGNGDHRADPFDPADAVPAAADYLCAHNAARDVGTAVASYFCGGLTDCQQRAQQPGGYADRVLTLARRYTDQSLTGAAAGPAATIAVQVALVQVGTPYVWGGETPGIGFDCSGLVQHSYAAAGITLPRTAQTQYNAGPHLPLGAEPQAGDLVFFGTSTAHVTHVGIALGHGRMVDAPRTGALVRVEPIRGFGRYLGATRPAARPDFITGTSS
ncbi:MAG: bifunctional lytic transglycosylase/C40 family peptidase [Mycobacteriales bacterium]|nr:bifunctional lytic transglycosylase/C40 family peptidase [Mycobacteriales bacterium]